MAVNTYIGARYVPLMMGQWIQSNAYEPLSVVQWQGNSYTSKCYVPANTEITNQVYWVQTANFNAQVDQYRQDVVNLENKINSITLTIPPSGDLTGATDLTAIQAAFDEGKAVQLMSGDYYINNSLKVKAGTSIFGCGKITNIYLTNDTEFMSGYANTSVDSLYVHELKINAPVNSTKFCFNFLVPYTQPYIGARYCEFSGVYVNNFYAGFNGSAMWSTVFINCRFVCLSNAINLGNAVNAILFLGCQFYLSDLANPNTGTAVIYTSRSNTENYNVCFINCDIEKFQTGLNLATTIGVTIVGCYWEKVSLPIQLDSCPATYVSGGNMNQCDLVARVNKTNTASIFNGLSTFENLTVDTNTNVDKGMIIPSSDVGKVFVKNLNIYNRGTGKCWYLSGEMGAVRTQQAYAVAAKRQLGPFRLRYTSDSYTFWFENFGVTQQIKLQPMLLVAASNFEVRNLFTVHLNLNGVTVANAEIPIGTYTQGQTFNLSLVGPTITTTNAFTLVPSNDPGIDNSFWVITKAFIGEFSSPAIGAVEPIA